MPIDYTEILIHIRKIVRSLNLESKRIQKQYNISIPQLLCLQYLSGRNQYQATHKEIAQYLNLNSSTITGLISRLEKKSYVARLPKMGDKRQTYIALTFKGAELLEKSPELLHEQLSDKLRQLPEQKLMEIQEALTLLVTYLNIEDVEASPLITIEEVISPAKEN